MPTKSYEMKRPYVVVVVIVIIIIIIIIIITYSMEQSPSWKANKFSPGQDIPCTL